MNSWKLVNCILLEKASKNQQQIGFQHFPSLGVRAQKRALQVVSPSVTHGSKFELATDQEKATYSRITSLAKALDTSICMSNIGFPRSIN